jgi:D-alanyl-D-alanine carboxypeptidase/D-alanyl-D-alanine-endopeptidase (penicillin-binding protein 4)
MINNYSRRAVIAALFGSAASGAFANAPLISLRPTGRPPKVGTITPEMRIPLADVIQSSGVTGRVGVVLADAVTGEIIDSNDADEPLPPASVTKAVTALYALESLGPNFQFETRIFANGTILDGILDGDLILSGGGNPNLVTDDLAVLAERLKDSGLTEVRGKFYVYDGALPNLDEIDDSQLDHLGYNPAVTGLNLNFNRVHFEWKRAGGAYTVTMDARSERFRPAVTVAKMRIVDRAVPVYTYRDGGGLDEWTVARGALGSGGSRWLPVRYPALYAGEVFATFARGHGIVLTPPSEIALAPQGTPIAVHKSVPLRRMMQDMLRFSTNITAEAAGMAATEERTGQKRGLRTSALGMTWWANDRAGITPSFTDHSGLGDATRLSAADMVTLLNADGVDAVLKPILKTIALRDDQRRVIKDHPAQVVAKTGTLNFVSALAGYIQTASGRKLTFTIFAADLEARAKGRITNDEQPIGSISYNTNAKKLQNKLLLRWAALND